MKTLLLLTATCLAAIGTSAQNAGSKTTQEKIQEALQNYRLRNMVTALPADTLLALRNLTPFANRKPGIYRLPQDGMPCIVPDTSKTVQVPNAWQGKKTIPYRSHPPRIPNIAKPQPAPDDTK